MKFSALVVIFWFPLSLIGQYAIHGKVKLDSSWDHTIYLSLIPDLEDLYRCSELLIIAKSDIGKDGTFVLQGGIFPDQPHLVRMHISKKGDPPATLIIGGKDENHGFLALNKDSNLYLSRPKEGLFDHFNAPEDPQNQELFYIDSLRHYFTAIDTAFSSIDYKKMVQEKQTETLLAFADTTHFILPALYAIYHADWGPNLEEIKLAQSRLANRLPAHVYLQSTQEHTEEGHFQFLLWGGIVMLILFAGGFLVFVRKQPPAGLQELSVQERKILAHLHDGKSNKEIAGQLHIEPTTVKSHVYSIYQKLNISSRKEVSRFGQWIK